MDTLPLLWLSSSEGDEELLLWLPVEEDEELLLWLPVEEDEELLLWLPVEEDEEVLLWLSSEEEEELQPAREITNTAARRREITFFILKPRNHIADDVINF